MGLRDKPLSGWLSLCMTNTHTCTGWTWSHPDKVIVVDAGVSEESVLDVLKGVETTGLQEELNQSCLPPNLLCQGNIKVAVE